MEWSYEKNLPPGSSATPANRETKSELFLQAVWGEQTSLLSAEKKRQKTT